MSGPKFNDDTPRVHPSSEADLDVDFSTCLKVVAELGNIGSLAPDLFSASATASQLTRIDELQDLINFGTDSTVSFTEIPSASSICMSAYSCGVVGNTFLECIGQLWGVDSAEALRMLAPSFDPEPGYSWGEFLDDASKVFGVGALIVGAFLTAGAEVPAFVLWLSIGGGFAINSTGAFFEYQQGNIDLTALLTTVIAQAALQGASAYGVLSSAEIVLGESPIFQQLIYLLGTEKADALTGYIASDNYRSDLEALIEVVRQNNPEIDTAVFENNLRNFITQFVDQKRQTEELDSLTMTPTAGATHTVPDMSAYHAPTLEAPYVNPVTGQEIVMNKSEEESAWWDARQQDYRNAFPGPVVGAPDFYQWLLDQDIRLPEYVTREEIIARGQINMTTGPCTPTGN